MAISFSCSGCGTRYQVRDDLGGKKTRCKKCSKVIEIPRKEFDDDLPDLSAIAPDSFARPTLPASPPPASTYRAAPAVAQPVSGSAGLGTLKIPEGLNNKIAMLLVIVFIGFVGVMWYNVASVLSPRLPESLQSRVWIWMSFSAFFAILQFLLITCAVGWICVQAAAALAKSSVKSPSFLLSAGAMACPGIAVNFVLLNVMSQSAAGRMNPGSAIDDLIALLLAIFGGLIIGAVLLQALLHLNWKTSLICWAIMIFAMPATLYMIGRFVHPKITEMTLSMSGLTPQEVQKWVDEHPDEVRMAARSRPAETSPEAEAARQKYIEEEKKRRQAEAEAREAKLRADPLYGKTAELEAGLGKLRASVPNLFKEELQPDLAKLKSDMAALKPASPSDLWDEMKGNVSMLQTQINAVPARKLPDYVFEKPSIKPSTIQVMPDDALSPVYKAFGWSFRIPKTYALEIGKYDHRKQELRFSVDKFWGPTIVIKPVQLMNPKQEQPLFYSDDRYQKLAQELGLLAYRSGTTLSKHQIGDVTFFELPSEGHAGYLAHSSAGWLQIQTERQEGPRETNPLPLLNLLPTLTPEVAKAIDPYSPALMAPRIDEDSGQVLAILKDGGEASIPLLKDYIASAKDVFKKRDATAILKQLSPDSVREGGDGGKVIGSKDLDPKLVFETFTNARDYFAKQRALKDLSVVTADESMRENVAKALEAGMLAQDGYEWGEEYAAALRVWQRPQTLSAIMPLLANERLHPWLVKPVIKIAGASHDKMAVKPVLRWIIKEPDTVVAAAIELGAMTEDETIKLLSEKDGGVRRNAARILNEVGTKKSMGPLLRASKDQRDPSAAAMADAAYQLVKQRTANSPATTQSAK